MKEELESIKFNLTPSMSLELIKFNKLKKELNKLKELYNLDKNEKLLLQMKNIENELVNCKNKFINEFRINNVQEIKKYLEIKGQKN